ncbi:hypothetical protein [Lentibacillus persicus]|uniref:hypothetical protein n=1 Tax=Lentibacillus persicus TaxID=640948 RepID=UPI001C436648|nr:hypothetical protein [Lentibacillus persicus]
MEKGKFLNKGARERMSSKKFNITGKIIAFIGMWAFAFGIALNKTISSITGIPEPYVSFSIPLIVIGILLLITSNLFKRNRKK